MAGFLYYWRDYSKDTQDGPIKKLNQSSATMAEIKSGDVVWAIAYRERDRYALAAEFIVSKTGENNPSSADAALGRLFFECDPKKTRYFDTDRQAFLDPIVRKLTIKADAKTLAYAFQGPNGVRHLSDDDFSLLLGYSASLARDLRLNSDHVPYEHTSAAESDLNGLSETNASGLSPDKCERLQEVYLRDQTLPKELRRIYGDRCQICDSVPFNGAFGQITEAHHITWLSRGGADTLTNMVLLCPSHHAAMHAADPNFDSDRLEFAFGSKRVPIRVDRHLRTRRAEEA